jgi:hypothetical protein
MEFRRASPGGCANANADRVPLTSFYRRGLSAIAEKPKRRSKDDFKGRHFEASLILQAVCWYLRDSLSGNFPRPLCTDGMSFFNCHKGNPIRQASRGAIKDAI